MKKITILLITIFISNFSFSQYDIKTTWNLDFEDISTTGTNLNLGDDDEINITAPFDIYLGYQKSRNLRISNNGAILFDTSTGDVASTNGDLQTSTPMIAPFWDDLDSELGGVYVQYFNNLYTIQWNRVHYEGSTYTEEAIFQVVFNEFTKDITFVYENVDLDGTQFDNGASATIGISTSTDVVLFSKDTSSLSGIQTITFIPDGLTYVPDDNFESYLENHWSDTYNPYFNMGNGIDNDNYVYTSHIELIEELFIIGEGISLLTGIADFKNLRLLYVSSNIINHVDFSNNKKLGYLNIEYNNLTNLDLSYNIMLTSLYASDNSIDNLILHQNLESLSINNNNLTELDLSYNYYLISVYCNNNQIAGLLNLSNNPYLEKLECTNNQISGLNIANGNNNNLINVDARFNTNLTCIQVDDTSQIGADWQKDAAVQYNEDCFSNLTYVPDANFEQKLIDLGYDDVLDNYVTTSNINTVTSLQIDALSISSLTGIEDFTALTYLNCNDNAIHNLDVSHNTNLITLKCNNNDIPSLDLSNNLNLVTLECAVNRLQTLDLHLNAALTNVYCDSNELIHLNIKNGNNYNIWGFWALDNHNLYCIDVDDAANTPPTGNAQEWYKDPWASYGNNCYDDEIYIVDHFFEQRLEYKDLGNGVLNDHYVSKSKVEMVEELNVSSYSKGHIANLSGIEFFTSLKYLDIENNQISTIDLSQNSNLERLNISDNPLTSLDVSQNIALKIIGFSSTNFTDLNLDNNINLEGVYCYGNDFIETVSIQNGHNDLLSGLDVDSRGKVRLQICDNLTCVFVDDVTDANNGVNDYEYWDIDGAHYVATQAECDNLLSINDNSLKGVLVYPNPIVDVLNIQANNTIENIKIFNMLGRKVLEKTSVLNTVELDLSTLSTGNYIIKIQSNNQIGTYKIIKQ